jgi:hypothetical protein
MRAAVIIPISFCAPVQGGVRSPGMFLAYGFVTINGARNQNAGEWHVMWHMGEKYTRVCLMEGCEEIGGGYGPKARLLPRGVCEVRTCLSLLLEPFLFLIRAACRNCQSISLLFSLRMCSRVYVQMPIRRR